MVEIINDISQIKDFDSFKHDGFETGLSIVTFSDIGAISDNWADLNYQKPMFGLGGGIRIPFPIVGVLRIDYGWGYRNGDWNSGIIHWGIGQKF